MTDSVPDPRYRLQTADGLSVAFMWGGDRFTHRIETCASGLLATSLDGDAPDIWPSHPPLQQLTREERPEGPVLLGVGMAGSSHWSLAVSQLDEAIRFEVACRVRGLPERLGSTYRIGASVRPEPDGMAGAWQLEWPGGACRLVPDEATEVTLSHVESSRPEAPGCLTIAPQRIGSTACWGYRWCLG